MTRQRKSSSLRGNHALDPDNTLIRAGAVGALAALAHVEEAVEEQQPVAAPASAAPVEEQQPRPKEPPRPPRPFRETVEDGERSETLVMYEDHWKPRARARRRRALQAGELTAKEMFMPFPIPAPIVNHRSKNEIGAPFSLMCDTEDEMWHFLKVHSGVQRDRVKQIEEVTKQRVDFPRQENKTEYYITISLEIIAALLKWTKSRVQRTMNSLINKKIVQRWDTTTRREVPSRGRASGKIVHTQTTYRLPPWKEVLSAVRDDAENVCERFPLEALGRCAFVYGRGRKLVRKDSPLAVRLCIESKSACVTETSSATLVSDAPPCTDSTIDTDAVSLELQTPDCSGASTTPTESEIPASNAGLIEVEVEAELEPEGVAESDTVIEEAFDQWSDGALEEKIGRRFTGPDADIPKILDFARRAAIHEGSTITNQELWQFMEDLFISHAKRHIRWVSWWIQTVTSQMPYFVRGKQRRAKQQRYDFERHVAEAFGARDQEWMDTLKSQDEKLYWEVVNRIRGPNTS